jgi:hypothetical protein
MFSCFSPAALVTISSHVRRPLAALRSFKPAAFNGIENCRCDPIGIANLILPSTTTIVLALYLFERPTLTSEVIFVVGSSVPEHLAFAQCTVVTMFFRDPSLATEMLILGIAVLALVVVGTVVAVVEKVFAIGGTVVDVFVKVVVVVVDVVDVVDVDEVALVAEAPKSRSMPRAGSPGKILRSESSWGSVYSASFAHPHNRSPTTPALN